MYFLDGNLDSYKTRILNLCAIYVILSLSMNLINGFTGLFSLGHAGFIAIGAYTTAILSMPIAVKAQNFFLAPMMKPLDSIYMPFIFALIIGGIFSAIAAYLIGAPALRLKGDYLAIATLGFAEIIRVVLTNTQTVTNGALGLKGIPPIINLWWTFGLALITIIVILSLINSSYGRALKAIREDEIAAESMGINLFKHKVLAFIIGAFFAGIGGGLLANLLGTIDPLMFRFTLTFNILLIIVLGGMGSVTGTIIAAFVITIAGEALRFLDESINLGFVEFRGVAGLRMVVFSALLMLAVLFFRNGVMGTREFSWNKLVAFLKNIKEFRFFKRKATAKGGK
ncbi:branched-chain amino acid ABC transporter permease [Clostridium sp. UBA4548]|uniref:branched-chain amino acid ABC transporter permease n=1 Tax=Clostridium sp. UBA4548 TaxID=1946361 RepID=UPI0025BF31E2|nr:branched-chain amino acid ABC transporter permease [Clostridium sp. UBA4548]